MVYNQISNRVSDTGSEGLVTHSFYIFCHLKYKMLNNTIGLHNINPVSSCQILGIGIKLKWQVIKKGCIKLLKLKKKFSVVSVKWKSTVNADSFFGGLNRVFYILNIIFNNTDVY